MTLDLVLKNSGTQEQAKDLFQEVMTVLFEKVQNPDFALRSSIKTYLYAVARNKWLMLLRSRRTQKTDLTDTENLDFAVDATVQEDLIQQERNNLMRLYFQQLGSDCQQVLDLFFARTSMREIAKKMGFSEAYAKKRKFTCQKKLIALVTADSRYQELVEK